MTRAEIEAELERQQRIQQRNPPSSSAWLAASAEIHRLAELLTGKEPTEARREPRSELLRQKAAGPEVQANYRRRKYRQWLEELGILSDEMMAEYDAADFHGKDELYEETRDAVGEERRDQLSYRRQKLGLPPARFIPWHERN